MYTAFNKNNEKVSIDEVSEDEPCHCGICKAIFLQKRGQKVSPYFAHKPYEACSDTWTYGNSEWQRHWEYLFPKETREVIIGSPPEQHLADVALEKTVLEFCVGRMSVKFVKTRIEFFNKEGYNVVWIFDLFEERKNGTFQLSQGFDQYWWDRPHRLFSQLDIPNERVAVYFDLGVWKAEEPRRVIKLLKKPMGNLCAADDPLTEQELVEKLMQGQGLKNLPLHRSQLADGITFCLDLHGSFCAYGCFRPESIDHFIPADFCSRCSFHPDRDKAGPNFCTYRFRNLGTDDLAHLSQIEKNKFGQIQGYTLNEKGKPFHYSLGVLGNPGWSLEELSQAKPKCSLLVKNSVLKKTYLVKKEADGHFYGREQTYAGQFSESNSAIANEGDEVWILLDYQSPNFSKHPSHEEEPPEMEPPQKIDPLNQLDRKLTNNEIAHFLDYASKMLPPEVVKRVEQEVADHPEWRNREFFWWQNQRYRLQKCIQSGEVFSFDK
jgi:hypothetical protein